MEVVRRHILKRIDGVPVDIRYNPVREISRAVRLTPELFEQLMTGHFKPEDREQYYLQEIEVTYREVTEDEREHESL